MDSLQLVTLRTEVRELEARLKALEEFRQSWNTYAGWLYEIAERLDGQHSLPESDDKLKYDLTDADDLRNRLRARLATVLGSVRQPMSTILSESLRSPENNLVRMFLVSTGDLIGTVPEEVYSPRRAEEILADCDSILEEKKLELEAGLRRQRTTLAETERVVREDRKHELMKISAAHPTIWKQLKETWPVRFLAWLWKATWGKVLSGAVILLVITYIVPPLRKLAIAFVHLLAGTTP